VVFGQLRTSDAVSHLAPGEVVFSVVGFSLLYVVMLIAYVAYIIHTVRIGPGHLEPDERHPVLDLAPMAGLAGGRAN
jgi:cytochrome bd ubiquinol oxidase subunit I